MAPNATKGLHYVEVLNAARAEGRWDEVPELIRKIRKHAPERICLTIAAETEVAIEKVAKSPPIFTSQGTAVAPGELDVGMLLPQLADATDNELRFPEDKYQGQVCIGWLHWVVGHYNDAAVNLPKNADLDLVLVEVGERKISTWTKVCSLKAAYLKANCLARNHDRVGAIDTFNQGLPTLIASCEDGSSPKLLRYWAELYLTEFCMLSAHALQLGESHYGEANCLTSFRNWAWFWSVVKGTTPAGGFGFKESVPRRRIWLEYYKALSAILEEDQPYPQTYVPAWVKSTVSARGCLREELQRTENNYERLLLAETEFPGAEDRRDELEAFIVLVMQNWTIFKGRGWRDQDLGTGGKDGLSRSVLDILYRASMRTYHSTAILRHLFTVHLAVAEFTLAFKAFDSYFDLLKKGKARVVKTGHLEPALDKDPTVLETVALCIAALCRYGDREAAEKAYSLSLEMEHALEQLAQPVVEEGAVTLATEGTLVSGSEDVPPRSFAQAWQAIGLAHAQWARATFEQSSRAELQLKAIKCLRKSLSPEYGRSANLRSIFALGMLLAEQRELSTAIEVVKSALLANAKSRESREDIYNGLYWKERALIPLWHLLALLLSAKQDYVMAARACEGAFEQFKDPAILFGNETLYRSEHLNEADVSEKSTGTKGGVVDEMDDDEKEHFLEVKMTQLALIEVLETPQTAVNASLELLSLYTRLFGTLQLKPAAPPPTTMPKSSAGTLRSIKGSIFGRGSRPSTKQGPPSTAAGVEKMETIPSRPATMQTYANIRAPKAPKIKVTEENMATHNDENRQIKKAGSNSELRSNASVKRNSLRKRDSSSSRRRATSSGGTPRAQQHNPTTVDGENYFTPMGEGYNNLDFFQYANNSTHPKRTTSLGPPPVSMGSLSRTTSHGAESQASSRSRSRASENREIPVDGIEPSSSFMPLIQFSKEHENRHRTTILIRVWLQVAGFYRRAEMFDDAKSSIAEAKKLVAELELEVAKDTTGSVSLRHAGWAARKCVEELWGDVWAELGQLSLALEAPYDARCEYEHALSHFPDHPAAIVGLSNILLDVYSEKLLPPASIPTLNLSGGNVSATGSSTSAITVASASSAAKELQSSLPSEPLGLGKSKTEKPQTTMAAGLSSINTIEDPHDSPGVSSDLTPPYKAAHLPLVDRLAARDRAYGLLSGLTKLGSAWNNSEAWFALSRAHEESGSLEKAKEVLWWCVELEEGMAVRDWNCVGTGGYVL